MSGWSELYLRRCKKQACQESGALEHLDISVRWLETHDAGRPPLLQASSSPGCGRVVGWR